MTGERGVGGRVRGLEESRNLRELMVSGHVAEGFSR